MLRQLLVIAALSTALASALSGSPKPADERQAAEKAPQPHRIPSLASR